MPIPKHEAYQVIDDFKKEFKSLAHLNYFVFETRKDFENVYGVQNAAAAEQHWGNNGAAYSRSTCASAVHVGRLHDKSELKTALAHEGLGHAGINTFSVPEKRALLGAIIDARQEPMVKDFWRFVDAEYPGRTEEEKAEEVYCFIAERVIDAPPNAYNAAFQHAWQNSVLTQNEKIQMWGVGQIAQHVAEGLRNNTRSIQIIPANEMLLYRTAPREPLERNPHALDAAAKQGLDANLQALRSNTAFDGRDAQELHKLAYWRSMLGELNQNKPLGEVQGELAKFDQQAQSKGFAMQLPSPFTAEACETAKTREIVRDAPGMSL